MHPRSQNLRCRHNSSMLLMRAVAKHWWLGSSCTEIQADLYLNWLDFHKPFVPTDASSIATTQVRLQMHTVCSESYWWPRNQCNYMQQNAGWSDSSLDAVRFNSLWKGFWGASGRGCGCVGFKVEDFIDVEPTSSCDKDAGRNPSTFHMYILAFSSMARAIFNLRV